MSTASPIETWAADLAVFPEDVAATLHHWLLRLESALGPLRLSSSARRGEPDGFDGVAHRGSYERLLLSEWMLADELPDEFLRRAAASEHTFLRLAEQTPHSARESIVLLDAGPWQLGSPRLAHLALLIALRRRAEKARARFSWGVLQAGAGPLFDAVDSHTVPALLAARTLTSASAPMLETWRARLDAGSVDAEVWLVGSQQLAHLVTSAPQLGARTEHVVVTERDGALDVSIGGAQKRVELALPEDALVTRMLRDPFAGERRARRLTVARTTDRAVMSACGRKLLARGERCVLTFPVPNSSAAKPGRPKRHYLDGLLLAAALHRGLVTVLVADRATRALSIQTIGGVPRKVGHFTEEELVHAPWKPEDDAPLQKLHVVEARGDEFRAFYVDGRRRLFEFRLNGNVGRLLARDVLAVASLQDGIAVAAGAFSSAWIPNAPKEEEPSFMVFHRGAWSEPEPLTGEMTSVWLRCAVRTNATDARVISAISTPHGIWHVHGSNGPRSVENDEGAEVVGLHEPSPGQPELLVVAPDRRSLRLVQSQGFRTVHATPSPIAHVSQADLDGRVLLELESKELQCFSLERTEVVAAFTPERASTSAPIAKTKERA